MSVIANIVKAHYVATGPQVQALARDASNGDHAAGTYLKVLVAASQATLSDKRKVTAKAQRIALRDAHHRYYPHVLRGVGVKGIEMSERNRRATFARTAASTVRHFLKAGGDLRELEAADVTKAKLRSFGEVVPTGTRAEVSLQRSAAAILRAARRLAAKDPASARKRLTVAIHAMQELFESIPARRARQATTVRRVRSAGAASAAAH